MTVVAYFVLLHLVHGELLQEDQRPAIPPGRRTTNARNRTARMRAGNPITTLALAVRSTLEARTRLFPDCIGHSAAAQRLPS